MVSPFHVKCNAKKVFFDLCKVNVYFKWKPCNVSADKLIADKLINAIIAQYPVKGITKKWFYKLCSCEGPVKDMNFITF